MHEARTQLGPAPARVVYADDPARAGERGTVLFFHGLGSSKEAHDKELASLAAAGFLAVGLDNRGHGERLHPRFAPDAPQQGEEFWGHYVQAVLGTAKDVPAVLDDLVALGVTNPARVGVAGISMGGAVAYAAPLAEHRVQAIAPLVARPAWYPDIPESPHYFPERFFPVAILSQTGGADTVVPPGYARDFHRELEARYREAPHRLAYREYPGAGHAFPGEQWEEAWAALVGWFAHFLRREPVRRVP